MVIESSFGRLKASLNCLQGPMDKDPKYLAHIIHSFTLNNFCELNNEYILIVKP